VEVEESLAPPWDPDPPHVITFFDDDGNPIEPEDPPEMGGVREPRRPRPSPPSLSATNTLDYADSYAR
jgi:hypothetical protein